MRLGLPLIILVLSLTTHAAGGVYKGDTELIERMKAGGHILMIRHALAPGFGDPSEFQIGDCATQRNLNDEGREQARMLGDWFRSQEIASARIFSSQWCRCRETAALLKMGPVTELRALNSFFEKTEDREPNLTALRKFIARQDSKGELIILVTHQVTISAVADEYVSSGEGVLLELKPDGNYKAVGRLGFE